ncbi:hypothetical protein [Staphylococcus epidermidis]|uniref:hypothetical protein n=1 Tax=Staphylococcus epidermidis TaxID=1282 RepID=UPI0007371B62|nr:hypothetical protein [Staphylococcus epidermidis]KTT58900.1 hypothetical protein SB7C_11435 [Staphylococcus epidermidis]KTT81647.1 hypothetical protein SA6_03210 [Staphylococcus epidermidis]KTW03127.1 hypothetical protein SA8_04980 [Staphylococcus epidermidis]KTW06985.1 hypothetical protein SB7B_03680 [Staphylococcus epidermidis]MCV7446710.1 hypothetical protein [Staphylococcus epidermidis]
MTSKNKSNLIAINDSPKYQKTKIKNDFKNFFSTGTIGYSEIEGDGMNTNYITRPEFEQHEKHMDYRFDNVEGKIDDLKDEFCKDIKAAKNEIKLNINKEKVTTKRFWIGITIPAVISSASLLVSIISLFLK